MTNSIKMFRQILCSSIYLIFCGFIKLSYQQTNVFETTNKDLTFCIHNHTMSNTLQTFWQDATSDCEMAPRRLMELYTQLKDRSAAVNEDQCNVLLMHNMRKKLINIMANQLEEAFVLKTLNSNRELKQILKDLNEIDKQLSQAIWERAINEIYLFIDNAEIIKELMHLKHEDILVFCLQYLLNKFRMETVQNETLLAILIYSMSMLLKSKTIKRSSNETLVRVYNRLPQELRVLYESSQHQIGLLNYGHWEYLYAPRDNGPDDERRTPLTWSQEKNTTDSDGHLLTSFNSNGLIAFGSRYGASTKYLYADIEHKSAFFWIGSGSKPSQWWNVIWSHELFPNAVDRYLIFENDETKELLCATAEYDENRRYVTLLNGPDNIENPSCQWLVKRF